MQKHFSKKYWELPLVAVAIATSLLTVGCEPQIYLENNQPGAARTAANAEFVQGELLVKFAKTAGAAGRLNALSKIKGQAAEKILTKLMQDSGDNEGITLVKTSMDVLSAIAALKGLPEVEYAEPNFIYQHAATSNDTYFTNGSLWGMYGPSTSPANQYGSQAAAAWAAGHTGSSTVYVGIIDEGYMYTHDDLAANVGKNPYESATPDGIDNDGNGFVDDIYGWDFDGNNSSVFDGVGDDHGTHVAGTIGGVGGNGKGVAGVCWNVKLLNAKFLGSTGGTTANAIKAVDYFTNLKKKGLNIVATNNSWGGGGFSQGLQAAIERANVAGILFIAAAGNATNNNDVTLSYPASYTNTNIIAVAALTNTGGLASYSNYGATTVDIGAPGSGIYSTIPTSSKGKIIASYANYSGTSMATPHVTGAAALYAAYHPGSTAAAIRTAILSSVVATPSLAGKCATGGRLNVSSF